MSDFVYIRNTIKLFDKRKNEFRNVILSDRTSKILNQYLLERKDENPYFFPSRKPEVKIIEYWKDFESVSDDTHMSEEKICYRIYRIMRRSKLDITWHTLRLTAVKAEDMKMKRRKAVHQLSDILNIDFKEAKELYEQYRGKFNGL